VGKEEAKCECMAAAGKMGPAWSHGHLSWHLYLPWVLAAVVAVAGGSHVNGGSWGTPAAGAVLCLCPFWNLLARQDLLVCATRVPELEPALPFALSPGQRDPAGLGTAWSWTGAEKQGQRQVLLGGLRLSTVTSATNRPLWRQFQAWGLSGWVRRASHLPSRTLPAPIARDRLAGGGQAERSPAPVPRSMSCHAR
jgi:hypothetical protein